PPPRGPFQPKPAAVDRRVPHARPGRPVAPDPRAIYREAGLLSSRTGVRVGEVRSGAALLVLRDLDRAVRRGRGPVHGADLHPLPGGPPGPAEYAARPPRTGTAL